jgi:hypothetical protein
MQISDATYRGNNRSNGELDGDGRDETYKQDLPRKRESHASYSRTNPLLYLLVISFGVLMLLLQWSTHQQPAAMNSEQHAQQVSLWWSAWNACFLGPACLSLLFESKQSPSSSFAK